MTSSNLAALHVGVVTNAKANVLLLWRAIESVLGQDYPHWTHVIVTSGIEPVIILDIIAPYREHYGNRLVLLHEENPLSPENAFNKGFAALKGVDFIAIHDENESWDNHFLSGALEGLHFQKQIIPNMRGIMTWCTAIHENMDGEKVFEKMEYASNGHMRSIRLSDVLSRETLPAICFLFERKALDEIGGMDTTLEQFGFRELLLRFLLRYDIGVIEKYLARHHLAFTPHHEYLKTLYPPNNRQDMLDALFHNTLLRRDMEKGQFGLGSLLALIDDKRPQRNIGRKVDIILARMNAPRRRVRSFVFNCIRRWRRFVSP